MQDGGHPNLFQSLNFLLLLCQSLVIITPKVLREEFLPLKKVSAANMNTNLHKPIPKWKNSWLWFYNSLKKRQKGTKLMRPLLPLTASTVGMRSGSAHYHLTAISSPTASQESKSPIYTINTTLLPIQKNSRRGHARFPCCPVTHLCWTLWAVFHHASPSPWLRSWFPIPDCSSSIHLLQAPHLSLIISSNAEMAPQATQTAPDWMQTPQVPNQKEDSFANTTQERTMDKVPKPDSSCQIDLGFKSKRPPSCFFGVFGTHFQPRTCSWQIPGSPVARGKRLILWSCSFCSCIFSVGE